MLQYIVISYFGFILFGLFDIFILNLPIQNIEKDKLNMYLNSSYNNTDKDEIEDIVSSGLSKTFKRARTTNDTTTISSPSVNNAVDIVEENDDEDNHESDDVDDTDDVDNDNTHQIIASQSDCQWLQILSGDCAVMDDGTILGQHEFSTVRVKNCSLSIGKWYYEVELLTDGLMQVTKLSQNFYNY